jgi:hypothetical protein
MATLPDHLSLPAHLFQSIDGCLYDTRDPAWSEKPPLRDPYCRSFKRIDTASALKATLRAGKTTDLGGYPLYFVAGDGEALSFEAVRAELKQCLRAKAYCDRSWEIIGCEVNYEDNDLTCAHTGKKIPSAYGDDIQEG